MYIYIYTHLYTYVYIRYYMGYIEWEFMVSHGDCHMMAVLVCKGHPIAGLRLMDSSRCDPGKGLVLR